MDQRSKLSIRRTAWRAISAASRRAFSVVTSFRRRRQQERDIGVEAVASSEPTTDRAEQARVPDHADERTIRRVLEEQHGGVSSEESDARFASGENPGGLHHRMAHHDGPEHQRPSLEEPQDRKERRPGRDRRMSAMRRGT